MILEKDRFTTSMESRALNRVEEAEEEAQQDLVVVMAPLSSMVEEDIEEVSATLRQMTSSNDSLVVEIHSLISTMMTSRT